MKKVAVYMFLNTTLNVKVFKDAEAWEEALKLFHQSNVDKDGRYRLITTTDLDCEETVCNYWNVGMILGVLMERMGADIHFERSFKTVAGGKKIPMLTARIRTARIRNDKFIASADVRFTDEFWNYVQGTVQNELGFPNAIINRTENTITFKED